VQGVIQASQLTSKTEQYYELYFNTINPVRSLIPFDIDTYKQPLDPPKLLQLHSILASSTNVFCSDKSISKAFETAAIRLAADLFDDFSYDSALGFSLLAFYFWGINQELYDHYQDISISLCKRVASRTGSPEIKIFTLRLHIVTIQMCGIGTACPILPSSFDNVQSTLQDMSAQYNTTNMFPPSCFTNEEFLSLSSFRVEIQKNIFPNEDQGCIPRVDGITFESLRCLMENIDCIYRLRFSNFNENSTNLLLTQCYGEFLRGILWQAVRNVNNALGHIRKVVEIFGGDENPLCTMAGPHFMTVFHYSFRIAHEYRNISLASRIHQLQVRFAKNYPGYEPTVLKDASLMQQLIHTQNGSPV